MLLKPFKDATEKLSGETYSTFCHALPLLQMLKNFLSDENLFDKCLLNGKAHTTLQLYMHEYPFEGL